MIIERIEDHRERMKDFFKEEPEGKVLFLKSNNRERTIDFLEVDKFWQRYAYLVFTKGKYWGYIGL